MRLTSHTDYALRVLMALALQPDRNVPVSTLAEQFRVSLTHLQKVVQHLGQQGWVSSARGRGGGVRLARPAQDIRIGDVIRSVEPETGLVECHADGQSDCPLIADCALSQALTVAQDAFYAALNKQTLASLTRRGKTPSLDALLQARVAGG